MNKQQLASKIWESANKMRSKIEANEYKDYILGFIFYKFLSEKEEIYLDKISLPREKRKEYVVEENVEIRENIQKNIGYFISNNDLTNPLITKSILLSFISFDKSKYKILLSILILFILVFSFIYGL